MLIFFILLNARILFDQEIYYLKPGKGKAETKVYLSKSFDNFKNSKKSHFIDPCYEILHPLFQIGKKGC